MGMLKFSGRGGAEHTIPEVRARSSLTVLSPHSLPSQLPPSSRAPPFGPDTAHAPEPGVRSHSAH